jgi:hypothetical protein
VERLRRQAGISGLVERKRGRTTIRVPGVRVAQRVGALGRVVGRRVQALRVAVRVVVAAVVAGPDPQQAVGRHAQLAAILELLQR